MMYDDVTKNNQGSSNMFMAGSAWAFVFGPCIGGTSPKSVSVAKVHVATCVCVCVCVSVLSIQGYLRYLKFVQDSFR